MRLLIIIGFLAICEIVNGQPDGRISTIEFVEIINGNDEEAIYYFENNWMELRRQAKAKGYISSYELIKTNENQEATFDIILLTIYTNKEAYDSREQYFRELINLSGGLKLLNDKKPKEFRKSSFSNVGKNF